MPRRLTVLLAAAAAVAAALAPVTAPAAASAVEGSSLRAGTTLRAGDEVSAPVHQHRLVVQGDGNVVLYAVSYEVSPVLFSTGTAGHPGATLTLQTDGNLVVYDATGRALWSNQVFVGAAAQVDVGDDGTLCESVGGGTPVWCAGRAALDAAPPNVLSRGQSVATGDARLASPTGRFRLTVSGTVLLTQREAGLGVTPQVEVWQPVSVLSGRWVLTMQTDGNLVAYVDGRAVWSTGTVGSGADRLVPQDDGNVVLYAGSRAVWASGTTPRLLVAGQSLPSGTRWTEVVTGTEQAFGGTLVMQGDGNLVTYDGLGHPRWQTGTSGHPGARLALQLDGNAVISDPAGRPLWASGTAGCGRHTVLILYRVLADSAGVRIGPYGGGPTVGC